MVSYPAEDHRETYHGFLRHLKHSRTAKLQKFSRQECVYKWGVCLSTIVIFVIIRTVCLFVRIRSILMGRRRDRHRS